MKSKSETLSRTQRLRLGLFILLLFGFVLVPFFLLEQQGIEVTNRLLGDSRSSLVVFTLVILGLTLDIFLPLPSTIIAATGATMLGGVPAFFAVWLGLSAGCVVGYEFGATAGHAMLRQMISEAKIRELTWLEKKTGLGVLVVCRFVPVLAEVSVLMAGSAGLVRTVFYPVCAFTNIAVAYIYVILTAPLASALG